MKDLCRRPTGSTGSFASQRSTSLGVLGDSTWSGIILGVSVRVILDEMNLGISRLSKTEWSFLIGWALSNQLKA